MHGLNDGANAGRGLADIFYHISVVVLSAGAALSLPLMASLIAKNFLLYWSFIENEKIFLIILEIGIAVLLILFFTHIGRNIKNRKASTMANSAGLVFVTPSEGLPARDKLRKLKERQGFARDIMVIGSTGFRTFVDQEGDLHHVIHNCRNVKIMLLDPFGAGASERAKSVPNIDITTESFREQITKSIYFLRRLKAVQKNIRLKLYRNEPMFKLVVVGDYVFLRHYHMGMDVRDMPEYAFKHDQNPGSLYTLFSHYFLSRWQDPDIPEYDLETDELVYRDKAGNEARRERSKL
jgi:hypothetical protein